MRDILQNSVMTISDMSWRSRLPLGCHTEHNRVCGRSLFPLTPIRSLILLELWRKRRTRHAKLAVPSSSSVAMATHWPLELGRNKEKISPSFIHKTDTPLPQPQSPSSLYYSRFYASTGFFFSLCNYDKVERSVTRAARALTACSCGIPLIAKHCSSPS